MPPEVLIVEDNRDVREALCHLLERSGYRAAGAPDGAEALALLARDGRPALILLDSIMPVMDGPAFLAVLRGWPGLSDLPAFLLTGDPDLTPEDAHDLGADGLLVKPVEPDDLIALVGRYSGRTRVGTARWTGPGR